MTVGPWRPLGEPQDETGPFEELRESALPADAVAIASVPAVLVAVFVLVGPAEPPLALSHAEPTTTSLVTAHFVHRSFAHLLDNLAAYLLVVPTAYFLALLSGRRREFAVAFGANLLLLPPVLSGLSLLAFDRGVTLGFSGVIMAFVGLLALQTGGYVEERLGDWGDGYPAVAVFFSGVALVGVRTIPPAGPRLAIVAGALAVVGLSIRGALDAARPLRRSVWGLRSDAGQLGAVGALVVGLGILAGFPVGAGVGPVVVNTFGHFSGFVIGFLGPYLAFRLPDGPRGTTDSPPEVV